MNPFLEYIEALQCAHMEEEFCKFKNAFEEIVDKASGKYGKERATKIAAAAMWKTYGGKKGKTRKEY